MLLWGKMRDLYYALYHPSSQPELTQYKRHLAINSYAVPPTPMPLCPCDGASWLENMATSYMSELLPEQDGKAAVLSGGVCNTTPSGGRHG